eukprot:12921653-Alexandrium_andersonii.AAC.1
MPSVSGRLACGLVVLHNLHAPCWHIRPVLHPVDMLLRWHGQAACRETQVTVHLAVAPGCMPSGCHLPPATCRGAAAWLPACRRTIYQAAALLKHLPAAAACLASAPIT